MAHPYDFVGSGMVGRNWFCHHSTWHAHWVAAQTVYDYAINTLTKMKFQDTGRSIAKSLVYQELIEQMTVDLETALR